MAPSPPPPAVSFARLPPGWRSVGGLGGIVATSWPYRPNSAGWAPSMPVGGIAVTVSFPSAGGRVPPLRLLLPRRPATLLDGTRDTPEYRIDGSVRGREVEIRVDIRRPHPTRVERRAAQRVLAAIRLG